MQNKKSFLKGQQTEGNGSIDEVERLTKELKNVKQELQRTREALERSEARLDAVVDRTPIALWEIDAEGMLVLVRERGLESSRLRSHLAVGKSIFELCGSDRAVLENISPILAGEAREWMWEVEDLVYETKVTPEIDSLGKIVGARGVSIDITDRYRASTALQKVKEDLEIKVEERTSA